MNKNLIACLFICTCLISAGCTAHVFNAPTTISTKVGAVKNVKRLEQVRATSTSGFFIVLPIIEDPRTIHDELLDEAKKVGGDAVIDYEVRNSSTFIWMFPPIIFRTTEGVGTAVKLE